MAGHRHASLAIIALGALLLGACSNDNEPTGGGGTPTGAGSATVNVALQEWAVIPAQGSIPAGSITFQVKNNGPTHEHEFVVVKTALTPDKLPVKADGSVDESGTGVTSIGEIEEMAVGKTENKTFTLAAGSYVLFCNVVDTKASPVLVHYKQGMRVAFSVT